MVLEIDRGNDNWLIKFEKKKLTENDEVNTIVFKFYSKFYIFSKNDSNLE
jgi:hypothetical protein